MVVACWPCSSGKTFLVANFSLMKTNMVTIICIPTMFQKKQMEHSHGKAADERPALELAGHNENGLHRAHAEVVVVLLRELLAGQRVQVRHFPRELARGAETLRVEDDLGDERVVRYLCFV